jgi:hypothetical protein
MPDAPLLSSNAEGPGGNGVLDVAFRRSRWEKVLPDVPFEERKDSEEEDEAIKAHLLRDHKRGRLWWEQEIPDIPFEVRKGTEEEETIKAYLLREREREVAIEAFETAFYEPC